MAALAPGSANAAFPGRNGLLAIEPVHGTGLTLARPDGTGRRHICAPAGACGREGSPQWSPDGRALVISFQDATRLIYDDGSCLDCLPIFGHAPAFLPSGTTISTGLPGSLQEFTEDRLPGAAIPTFGLADAVWSSTGVLARVSAGRLLVGTPPAAVRALGAAASASWSPTGRRLVIVRQGRITMLDLSGYARALARGSAPAFSPDGRLIAFIGPRHAVEVVPSAGGRVRRLRGLTGDALDWQPLPATAPTRCAPPPGSTVVAQAPAAEVTVHSDEVPDDAAGDLPSSAYSGCLFSEGRERVLESVPFGGSVVSTVTSAVAVAGPYAALAIAYSDQEHGDDSARVRVFDLRTGQIAHGLGGESVAAAGGWGDLGEASITAVVLEPDGVSAALTINTEENESADQGTETETERVVVSDGGHVYDADTEQQTYDPPQQPQPPSALSDLSLTDHVLSWLDNGVTHTMTLP